MLSTSQGERRALGFKYNRQQWHSDLSFTSVPSLGSLLCRITIPRSAGAPCSPTGFAWDTLSPGMKMIDACTEHTGSPESI